MEQQADQERYANSVIHIYNKEGPDWLAYKIDEAGIEAEISNCHMFPERKFTKERR